DDWRKWSSYAGGDRELAASLFADSHGLAVDLARHGAGIAVTSALLAAPCLDDGTLVAVEHVVGPSEDGFFIAMRSPASDATLAFKQWLLDEIERPTARIRTPS
ncbi:MAG: hypothetical protein AAF698_10880, partial [Pseudomonadota bacterium]